MTKALNLKYRPQKISELDQVSAQKALLKIFESGKFPHSFLLSGPKGIGKTSAARIVAKAVNCEKVAKETKEPKGTKEFEPCGKCATCVSITNGTNLDVLEIDGASNRGIDDIRELRDKIRLAPSSAKYKVYIIDEVHMLTNEAFNALLKTLEEPPEHAVFVLCTTAPEKLPDTIVSRCTRITFKKATKEEVVGKLEKIVKEEGFKFKTEDLAKIAKAAGGSFRDAIKLLEQATSSSVDEVLGVVGGVRVEDFLTLLAQRKTKEALVWLDKSVKEGINLRMFTEEVLEVLRQSLLGKYGVQAEETVGEWQDNDLTIDQLKGLINLFAKAALELRSAVIPQLPLEMVVIDFSEGEVKVELMDSEAGGERLEAKKEREEKKKDSSSPDITPRAAGIAFGDARQYQASHLPPLTSIRLEEILNKWPEVLAKVKPLNHSIQAFLRATRPLSIEEEFLTLEVFYKFHKDQLESDKCRKIVEEVCGQVLAVPVKIKYVLGERPKRIIPTPVAVPVTTEGLAEISSPPVKSEVGEDDLVKLAEEIFNKSNVIN